MKLSDATVLAQSLMSEHGLTDQGWKFRFDNAKSRLGLCTYTTKTISMSQYMVGAADEEQVRQTMLHEIAHALLKRTRADGSTIGHGREWKQLAASIGYTGKRTAANPYSAVRPASAVRPPAAVRSVDPIGSGVRNLQVTIGDRVRMSNGLTGTVISKGRSRWGILAENGQEWRAPFGTVIKLADGDGSIPTRAPISGPSISVGDTVKLTSGKVGTVVKRGRTRWHVAVDGVVWSALFESVTLVEPARRVAAGNSDAPLRSGSTALHNGAEVKVLTTSAENAIIRDAAGALNQVSLSELVAP